MKTSKLAAAMALVAVLALFGAACSSDDDATDESTAPTSEVDADGSEESGDPAPPPTDAPIGDEEYAIQIAALEERMNDAGSDICKLFEAQATDVPPPPSNPTQVEAMVEVYTKLLRQMGATFQSEEPEAAAAMDTAADELMEEAEATGFDPEFLSVAQPKAFSSEEFAAAQTVLSEKMQGCMDAEANAGTEEGAEG